MRVRLRRPHGTDQWNVANREAGGAKWNHTAPALPSAAVGNPNTRSNAQLNAKL